MKTNNLIYKVTKSGINYSGTKADIIVKISLNDECKNGHQDFAITADIYKAGLRSDRSFMAGGCCHTEIIKFFPKFKPFVALHLCDAKGIPMYAVENGFYHLKNGFNSKSMGMEFENEFCGYYRITPEQFSILKDSENSLEFGILLKELNILNQWEEEANKAIKQLEELTGNEFVNDSVKSQYNAPDPAKVEEFHKLKLEGFFTNEKKAERAIETRNEAREKRFNAIREHLAKEIAKETQEANIKLFILNRIDSLFNRELNRMKGFNIDFSFDNFIYYNHTNRIKFNWSDMSYYKTMSDVDFKMFCDSLGQADFNQLPTGISFECNGQVYGM